MQVNGQAAGMLSEIRPIAAYLCGSDLYGTRTEMSDVDILVIADHEYPTHIKTDGPSCFETCCLDLKPVHLRIVTKEKLLWAATLGKRWALDPWLSDDLTELKQSGQTWVSEPCSRSYDARTVRAACRSYGISITAFEDYEREYIKYAMADSPATEMRDYARIFENHGWHTNVGYYLLLELCFRDACVFGRDNLMDGWRDHGEFAIATKTGLVKKSEWYDAYSEWRNDILETAENAEKINTDLVDTLEPFLKREA